MRGSSSAGGSGSSMRGRTVRVLTDEKWLSFIIEQLSVQCGQIYGSEGSVTICCR